MKNYGKSSVSEFLDDFIVYRNLVPADSRLPPLAEVRKHVGIPAARVPRKSEADYARVIIHLLRAAQALRGHSRELTRLIYLGDTRLNDGTAFSNICHASGWHGRAFIGAENRAPAHVESVAQADVSLYLANRWSALPDFEKVCYANGLPVDEQTAVVIDMDKTMLGARGRNDHVINQARVEAVQRTVGSLLGATFDQGAFKTAYDSLNQTEFHLFTSDNQDYLAYICLIVGSGLYDLTALQNAIRARQWASFSDFIGAVDARASALPENLHAIHNNIYAYVQQNDPTPFKAFRRNEYRVTVERMGHHGTAATAVDLLRDEIVITQEVRAIALKWKQQGALLFGLSDKPDEASTPPPELITQGYAALHRTPTHAVGSFQQAPHCEKDF